MFNLSSIPLFQKLENAQNILISGAGGGFDIYCGLPLYFALKAQGKKVVLSNLSFTWLTNTSATEVCPSCWQIKATNQVLNGYKYFPEKFLAEWFLQQGELVAMYAFEKTGVNTLRNAFDFIADKHKIDAVVLIDGGTDSLLHGDEEDLGTPTEDSCSLAGAYRSTIESKFLVCLGFGVDHFHGVSHYLFLENVATLIRTGGFLGTFQLMKEMPEFEKYKEAIAYVNSRMWQSPSIVSNSIIGAIDGKYGNHHETSRTKGSEFLFLENVATLIRTGGFLGTFQLMKEMPEFEKYKEAIAYVNSRMWQSPSIVSNSIIGAIDGKYGNHHETSRTKGSELWINPLMGIYWCFQLENVVQQLKYFDHIKSTDTFDELKNGLAEFRNNLTDFRDNRRIPI